MYFNLKIIYYRESKFPRYFYDLNRDQRIEQYKINNIKNHKWRKKFPSQLFKNYSSIEKEPWTFATGGYKFFSGEFEKTRLDSVFNIAKCEEFDEQSYISVVYLYSSLFFNTFIDIEFE